MFGKNKNKKTSSPVKQVSHTPSIIAQDMRITGSVTSQGEVQLDGRIDGDIKAEHLVIGSAGVVEGVVQATSIIVKGKIIGSLNAAEVKIENNAHVHGDIFHDSLSIEAGAIIEGSLKHRFEEPKITESKENAKASNDVNVIVDDEDNELSFVNKPSPNKSTK